MSELSKLDAGMYEQAEQQLGRQQQIQVSKHGLYCEFYMHPVIDSAESVAQGRPIYKEVPYVMIMVPGDKDSIVRRPVRTGQHPKDDNNRFHNEYVAFLQNAQQPLQGTPLSEWSQITRAQVKELEYLNIRTVENLADLADGHAQQFMGLVDLKQKAKRWLDMTKAEAPMVHLQAELKERDDIISTMQAQMKEMQAEMAENKKAKKAD